jgi:hypothetical protein
MKARQVKDQNNLEWNCVQAFTGTNGEAAEKAAQITEENNSTVNVVCTPSGGAQTVRLKLHPDWIEKISDEELVALIKGGR